MALLVLLQLACFLTITSQVSAQEGNTDKSGVTPQVVSLPSGPGSLEGLGEAFEPDLSTGTATYPVNLTVAPGIRGFQPKLALIYNGGNANGPMGIGWRLKIPHIQRLTDEGLPEYDDEIDRYIDDTGKKLVRISQDEYRHEVEGLFIRYRRLPTGGWEAHTPDGVRHLFGLSSESRITTHLGVFRWHLERQIDTFGNRIEYSYLLDGGYAYIHEIRYNFSTDGRSNIVAFYYKERHDVFTDRRSRAPVSIGLRLHTIEIKALGSLVRSYRLDYGIERLTGRQSLLNSIAEIGRDGSSELPRHTFTYTHYYTESHAVVTMSDIPPVGLQDNDVDLVDINSDALPDLVHTPNSDHRFYINDGNGKWNDSYVSPYESPVVPLSSPNARMADMDGDGRVDFVVKAGDTSSSPFYFYAAREGQLWGAADARVDYRITPRFILDDPNLRLLDANNDKRVDFVLSTDEKYLVWLSRGNNLWNESADASIDALVAGGKRLLFSDPQVKLGDMTGDRLQDVVYVRDGYMVYFPHEGSGHYGDAVEMRRDPGGFKNLEKDVHLGDINNDGLDDVIFVQNRSVSYWLNRGDSSFSAKVNVDDTPPHDSETVVRLADMDGDGAAELLFSRSHNGISLQYLDFYTGTQPLLLNSIDNGLGRTYQIEYKPSTEYYIADLENERPWTTTLPFPVHVVSRVTVHDANSGEDYVTDYTYRNGYYDGIQKEFRGFAEVVATEHGDNTAPTTMTRYRYDVGHEDESRKGLILETVVLGEDGSCREPIRECYKRDLNQLTTRTLHLGIDGRAVSYSFVSQTDTFIHENINIPVHLREKYDRDEYGNLVEELQYGQVCDDDVTCGNDEILTYTEYAYNVDAWLLDRPFRIKKTNSEGLIVAEARLHYDGEAFIGLPLGQVERGALTHREESLGLLEDHRFVPTLCQDFDQFGNIVGILDANGNLTTVEYDDLVHTFPIAEHIHLDDNRSLDISAQYDVGFGTLTSVVDFNGHVSYYMYDAFGRITKIVLPGDSLSLPTQQFTYTLASPVSSIVSARREQSGTSNTLLKIAYYDGLGRQLQIRSEGENNAVVVQEATTFNMRQGKAVQFLPFFDDTFDYSPPLSGQSALSWEYDPLGRITRTTNPDGTFSSVLYHPLTEVLYDEEDNESSSLHFDTPKTLSFDGLDRLVMVQERNIVSDTQEIYTTTYRYDPLSNLTGITDNQGYTKTLDYDALSRRVHLHDPDRGSIWFEYDDAGNLIKTEDAKGQIIKYEYDAVNRPIRELWLLDEDTTVEYVHYHYDDDISTEHPNAQNTLGRLSYIEDQVGTEFFSYDARGNRSGHVRHFESPTLAFVTRMDYDAMDRQVSLTYADGFKVTYEYNEQGLLETIPGFIDNVEYLASGQRVSIFYSNNTISTYDYDKRLRLKHLHTQHGTESLQDLTYEFDSTNNIVSITDGRSEQPDESDQSQVFTYDALYRLIHAGGSYGDIQYAYDSIGNMVEKTGPAEEPGLTLAQLTYGEENTGPHALSSVGADTYIYDANGNLQSRGLVNHQWDYRDQLVKVDDGDLISSYAYDADGQRVRQVVEVGGEIKQILYPNQYTEFRNGELVHFIFDGDQRIAEAVTSIDQANLSAGLDDERDERLFALESINWYVGDHLRSTSLLVDWQGQTVSELIYFPYGIERFSSDADNVNYRFAGKEVDPTGLQYFGARFYDAEIGRFISVDPRYRDGFGTNLVSPKIAVNSAYAYAANNPIRYVDPTGEVPVETIADISSIGVSAYDFVKEPSWANAGFLVWDIASAALPYVPGSYVAKGGKVLGGLDETTSLNRSIDKTVEIGGSTGKLADIGRSTDFVVTPRGEAIPVPTGAKGPVSIVNKQGNTKGFGYIEGAGGPGLDPRVSDVRIMDPTPAKGASPGYPGGYVVYQNKAGQGVNPATGQTVPKSDPSRHIPLKE